MNKYEKMKLFDEYSKKAKFIQELLLAYNLMKEYSIEEIKKELIEQLELTSKFVYEFREEANFTIDSCLDIMVEINKLKNE